MCEELLGSKLEDEFYQFVSFSKLLTDWAAEGDETRANGEEAGEAGIAVQLGDDEDDDGALPCCLTVSRSVKDSR